MREIKFRGKRIDNGEWVYGYLVKKENTTVYDYESQYSIINNFGGNVTCCQECGHPECSIFEVIPESVGQYIQRLNGYEIYVGDIVQAYKYGDKETRPYLYEITYRNGTYWFGSWTWIEFLQTFRCVEVIDYFCENPEVREVQNE